MVDGNHLLAEVPATTRDLVLGHWPETDVDGMRRCGDAYMQACRTLNDAADRYEKRGTEAEGSVGGVTQLGLAERHKTVAQATRDKAETCRSLGQQCYDTADASLRTMHLLTVTGIVLAAQLAYDALLFFQGGGMKALADRLEAEQAMRAAAQRLTAGVAERAAIGAAERAPLRGALQAAGIGALTGGVTSAAAQAWDLADGIRDEFSVREFVEQVLAGTLGGAAGAEAGRRLAPTILERVGGRATSRAGRLASHIGGTVLLGGAGGITGGVVGSVPVLISRAEDIHTLNDLFKQVRDGAITGFAGGFVGAGFSGLRVHRAGRDAFRESPDLYQAVARHRDFSVRIRHLLDSGEVPAVHVISRSSTQGDSARVVERLTFADGTEVIHKIVSAPQHAHAEFLTSLTGHAIGARVPAVHIDGRHVYMEVVPGRTGLDAYPRDWSAEQRFFGTPAGVRLGVLDVLVRPLDRNAENWMVAPDADVWAIDNSLAYVDSTFARDVISPFAEQFQQRAPDGTVQWKNHDLSRAEVQEIRRQVDELRPAFFAAGRRDWHDVMLHRLDQLEAHAVDGGGNGGHRATAPPPPRPPGDPISGAPEPNGRATPAGHREVSAPPRNDRPAPLDGDGRPDGPASSSERGRGETPWTQPAARPPVPHDVEGSAAPGEGPLVPRDDPNGPEPHEHPVPPSERTPDGPPTRPLPPVEPTGHARDAETSRVPPDGQTRYFRHPDGGHVDVALVGPDGSRVPVRLLPGQEYVLGRGTGELFENVATAESGVSRGHAIITVDDHGHVFVRDHGSRNGTYVDGKQVVVERPVRVYDGQSLLLGPGFKLDLAFQRQMAEVRLFGKDGSVLTLHRGRTVDIGRAMVPPDAPGAVEVSRRHAVAGMDEMGRVWIADNGSLNGTWVNGERLAAGETRVLEPGDAVRMGGYHGRAEFVPPDAAVHVAPAHVRLGDGPEITPLRLEPGDSVPIGTDTASPFAAQLRGIRGVDAEHATLGLDHDGRLWIRDHPGSPGVWVNGDRIAPNQRVTLDEGDSVAIGPEFVGSARLGTRMPSPSDTPAELRFAPQHHQEPVRLAPGEQHSLDFDGLQGNAQQIRLTYDEHGNVIAGGGKPSREIIVGRDLDGRVWLRNVSVDSDSVEVNGRPVPHGEQRYLRADDSVSIGKLHAGVRIGEEPPMRLRVADDDSIPPISLKRGDEVLLGRSPESPLADQLAGHGAVSPRHATLYRDQHGNLWIRDEHSTGGTWVNNVAVRPDHPVQVPPGARIRLADWAGAAQYSDGFRETTLPPMQVRLNGVDTNLSFDLTRGGEPVLLGRENPRFPSEHPRYDYVSSRHASLGVHPSGRVWIRDEGSLNGTTVNGTKITPGVKMLLHPGDHVQLVDGYDFTVGFAAAEGGPFLDVLDQTPASKQALADLARVPSHIFQRVSDYMNAMPNGGIVIGDKRVSNMPGLEEFVQRNPEGPNDYAKWKHVAGMHMPSTRQLFIDSGKADRFAQGMLVWHEFGHAADSAFGTGGWRLSDGKDWQDLHAVMLRDLQHQQSWDHYHDRSHEAFAEAFGAWVSGPRALRKFALGDRSMANRLKEYFDRAFQ